jgi:alpha-glucosidase
MPWRNEPGGGFSSAEPWLPIDDRHLALAAEGQERDPHSVLAFTRAMIRTRKAHAALREGAFAALAAPDGVFLFSRTRASGRLICAFNLTDAEQRLPLPAAARPVETPLTGRIEDGFLVLPAWSGAVASAPI